MVRSGKAHGSLRFALAGFCMLLLAAGFAGASPKADSLVIATQSEPPSLTTDEHDSLTGVYMNLLTYNGLMRIDQGTLKVVPDLAESYSIEKSVDWIFKLKKGVKFHNGTELKATDVVASITYAKTFPGSNSYTGKIKAVAAVDDYTVKITTDGPYAGLLYDLGYHYNFILPKALIDAKNNFNANPVGTGPYKFVKWTRGDSIEFTRNDQYFDKAAMPSIKSVIWRIIPEGTSRTIALQAGEVDFVYEVETTDIKRLKADKNVKVAEVAGVENWFLKLNWDMKPFDNVNLRKAINAAIDRDAIITAALNGFGKSSISCVPMGYAESTNDGAEGYSVEKAKAYLKAWGGNPASVTLPIICSNDTKVRIATIMQANLADIGIKVEIVAMDFATYLDKMNKGEYSSAIQSWSPSNALTYLQRYHSRRRAGNPGSINSPAVDALVEKAEATVDAKARADILQDIILAVNGLVPQPSLYQTLIFRAYSAKLEGVVPSATGYVDFHRVSWGK